MGAGSPEAAAPTSAATAAATAPSRHLPPPRPSPVHMPPLSLVSPPDASPHDRAAATTAAAAASTAAAAASAAASSTSFAFAATAVLQQPKLGVHGAVVYSQAVGGRGVLSKEPGQHDRYVLLGVGLLVEPRPLCMVLVVIDHRDTTRPRRVSRG